MKRKMLIPMVVFVTAFVQKPDAAAQVSLGADIASRYIWRGVDYGNSPSFQPGLSFTAGSFSLGTWGAYSFAGTGNVFAEHDLWASYGIETESGTISILYTDYYYPSAGLKYFDYDGTGGAHVLEAGLGYAGTEGFPISLKAFYNFHNDPDKSIYLEAGYPFAVDGVQLALFAGGSAKKSAWYVTQGGALINVGISAKKIVAVTESFSLPLSATFIVNPELEQSYLIFGFTL
jgi:hypothetical protein